MFFGTYVGGNRAGQIVAKYPTRVLTRDRLTAYPHHILYIRTSVFFNNTAQTAVCWSFGAYTICFVVSPRGWSSHRARRVCLFVTAATRRRCKTLISHLTDVDCKAPFAESRDKKRGTSVEVSRAKGSGGFNDRIGFLFQHVRT